MEIAKEYYIFCKEHGYDGGYSKYWSTKHIEVLLDNRKADEEIKLFFIGRRYVSNISRYRQGIYGVCVFAITNERLIIAKKKLFGELLLTVSLKNINDITVRTGLTYSTICIDTIRETIDIQVPKRVAQSVNTVIHDYLLH